MQFWFLDRYTSENDTVGVKIEITRRLCRKWHFRPTLISTQSSIRLQWEWSLLFEKFAALCNESHLIVYHTRNSHTHFSRHCTVTCTFQINNFCRTICRFQDSIPDPLSWDYFSHFLFPHIFTVCQLHFITLHFSSPSEEKIPHWKNSKKVSNR